MTTATAEKLDLDFAEFVGGPPVTVDPIEQLIAEADARLDRADAAVEAADKAAKEAEEAASNAQRARQHSDNLTISAGLMYIEAQATLKERNKTLPKEDRMTWEAYIEKHSRHSRSRVFEVMAIARSSNPKKAAQETRERATARKEASRQRKKSEATKPASDFSEGEGGALTDRVEPREWFERAKTHTQAAPSMQWARHYDHWYMTEHRKVMGFAALRKDAEPAPPPPPPPKPVAAPADHRVAKAIEFFFEGVPVNKRLWVQQRIEEQETTLKGEGPHIEWVKAYWASDPEVQLAIKGGIKLENTKRMEG